MNGSGAHWGWYKPWGLLPKVLHRLADGPWCYLGCLGPEERSLAAWGLARASGALSDYRLWEILDPPSIYMERTAARMVERWRQYLDLGGVSAKVYRHQLFEPAETIVRGIGSFLDGGNGNVLLDVSCFPKRFFFPLIRVLLRSADVQNLAVTYSVAGQYPTGALSQEPGHWRQLPLFGGTYPEPPERVVIVGVGYQPLGLPELLETSTGYQDVEIRLVCGLPKDGASFARTWTFLNQLSRYVPGRSRDPIRVNTMDVSDTFDHLCAITDGGRKYAIMAPYGPKPMSLAMCVFACYQNSTVFYTQPKAYNPDYSLGVGSQDGLPHVLVYALRLSGTDCFHVPHCGVGAT